VIGPRGATRQVRVLRHREETVTRRRDVLAVEEPLEIRVAYTTGNGSRTVETVAVTMRTPGDDFDLVAGFLHGEGLVERPEALQELSYCRSGEEQEYNVVEARFRRGISVDLERIRRNFYTTSSCGVCGKSSLEAVEAQGCAVMEDGGLRVSAQLLPRLPDILAEGQGGFQRTGGLHAAGLFHADGTCTLVREDVGRHNAVDKALGHAFLRRSLPAAQRVLVVSGRVSFEIVQKAVMAGVPILVAVGAPSSLAVDLATSFNQTLVGFARDGGFNIYAAPERVA
jgi:FdhD protein